MTQDGALDMDAYDYFVTFKSKTSFCESHF